MEKNVQISILLDFYGALLTNTQTFAIREHFDEDQSFAEIGDRLGKTRQAVHDAVKKGVSALYDYESKLGIMKRYLLFDVNANALKNMIAHDTDKALLADKVDALLALWEENDGI